MVFNVLACVLGLAAVAVYLKGVKYEKPGATPVMVILVLAAVVSVLLPYTGLRQRRIERRFEQRRHEDVRLLGAQLSAQLSEGAVVLAVRHPIYEEVAYDKSMFDEDDMRDLEQKRAEREEDNALIKERFEEGAGFGVELIVASPDYDYDYMNADQFNATLEPYRNEGVELVLSLMGMPQVWEAGQETYQLERLDCFEWSRAPLFAAVVGARYDSDRLREYIDDALLSAVALHGGEELGLMVVGADNVEELPDSSPR